MIVIEIQLEDWIKVKRILTLILVIHCGNRNIFHKEVLKMEMLKLVKTYSI